MLEADKDSAPLRFESPAQFAALNIEGTHHAKLNKLKKSNSEAFSAGTSLLK
jgi:hypothetical protein